MKIRSLHLKTSQTRPYLSLHSPVSFFTNGSRNGNKVKPISKFTTPTPKFPTWTRPNNFSPIKMSSTTTTSPPPTKKGPKGAIKETLLAPRFYTTDFDEMEQLFNTEINKNLNEAEFEALLQEFKTDYNQKHFVRNKEFKEAADKLLVEVLYC